MSILFAILLFSFLIFIHELGHFTAAKLSNVQVNEFALFMGPAIFKKQVGETLYSIRTIPIGGFCAMEGEDSASENPRSIGNAPWWKKLIILFTGPAMNFLVGVLIFGILYLPGNQIVVPVLGEFSDCCIFNHADGVHTGDEILEIDGEKIYVYTDVSILLDLNKTIHHDLVVLRDGKRIVFDNLEMAHTHENADGSEYLHYGFTFGQVREVDFLRKLDFVWKIIVDNIRNVRLSLQMLFNGKAGIQDMAGPVGIVQKMSEVAEESDTTMIAFLNMLSFGGMLAVNLAIMNLLPIPALDGGRILALLITVAYEKITHRKLKPEYEMYLHAVGMILLLGLMVVIMFKDIFAIFRG